MREPRVTDAATDGPASSCSRPIRDVLDHIEANHRSPIPMQRLAEIARVGVVRLITRFREEVGVPPHRYVLDLRVRHAQILLRRGVRPAVAALEAGFYDQSHLARHFKRVCGSTPGKYRGENRTGEPTPDRRLA